MATWNPAAIYSAIAAKSDADLLRWALEEMARDTALRADMARNPARLHGPRAKPRLPEADAYQALSDRLAALASNPIADGHPA